MKRSPNAAVCVAVTVAVTFAVTACGGTSGSTPAGPPASATATATATAAPAFATTAQLVDAVSTAAGDKSLALKFTSGPADRTVTGSGAAGGSGADQRLQLSAEVPDTGTVDLVLIGSTLYVRTTPSTSDKPWMKDSPDGTLMKRFGALGQLADINAQLAPLKVAGSITGATADAVDGAPATKYAITVDATKLGDGPNAQALVAEGVTSYEEQLWVGADNLPLRLSSTVPVQGKQSTTDTTYSDWGRPVEVAEPPADQVTDQIAGPAS